MKQWKEILVILLVVTAIFSWGFFIGYSYNEIEHIKKNEIENVEVVPQETDTIFIDSNDIVKIKQEAAEKAEQRAKDYKKRISEMDSIIASAERKVKNGQPLNKREAELFKLKIGMDVILNKMEEE